MYCLFCFTLALAMSVSPYVKSLYALDNENHCLPCRQHSGWGGWVVRGQWWWLQRWGAFSRYELLVKNSPLKTSLLKFFCGLGLMSPSCRFQSLCWCVYFMRNGSQLQLLWPATGFMDLHIVKLCVVKFSQTSWGFRWNFAGCIKTDCGSFLAQDVSF